MATSDDSAALTARAGELANELVTTHAARDAAIAAALDAGASVSDVARATGLSRPAVYAIRNRARD